MRDLTLVSRLGRSTAIMRSRNALTFVVALMLSVALAESANDIDPMPDPNEQKISPDCAAVVLTSGGILGAIAAAPMSTLVLNILGFTAVGVEAGSFAAWWQSTMPLVASGSLFASLTSIAMTGGVGGVGVATVGGLLGFGAGGGAVHFAGLCRAIDEEASKDSAAGITIRANTKAVKAIISSVRCRQRGKQRCRQRRMSGRPPHLNSRE